MDKVALVTGATSGIGYATSDILSKNGFIVYAASRHAIDKNVPPACSPLNLDVANKASRKSAIAKILKEQGRLDILINNAGYGELGAIEDVDEKDAKSEFEVNVFGAMALAQLVLPIMRKHEGGRIINVSSIAGRLSAPFHGWYSASKYAIEALSDAMRLEVEPFGIKVVLVEPGQVKTNWDSIARKSLLDNIKTKDYEKGAKGVEKYLEKEYEKCAGPDVVAKAILSAATKKNPKARYPVPASANRLILLKRFLPEGLFESLMKRSMD